MHRAGSPVAIFVAFGGCRRLRCRWVQAHACPARLHCAYTVPAESLDLDSHVTAEGLSSRAVPRLTTACACAANGRAFLVPQLRRADILVAHAKGGLAAVAARRRDAADALRRDARRGGSVAPVGVASAIIRTAQLSTELVRETRRAKVAVQATKQRQNDVARRALAAAIRMRPHTEEAACRAAPGAADAAGASSPESATCVPSWPIQRSPTVRGPLLRRAAR